METKFNNLFRERRYEFFSKRQNIFERIFGFGQIFNVLTKFFNVFT
nr:MAG TPA: Multidrug efflux pump-associated protein AcrZ [Caudoviricetes sp.]DAT77444.1 MAG TPA: Multidrug efflux pump-associated protein AcrZ [Caudoviricetes sp.]